VRNYIRIARIDHWIKNFFIFPGVALNLSWQLSHDLGRMYPKSIFLNSVLTFFAVSLVSSANYTINEWLDRDYDRLHPYKNHRPAVSEDLNPSIVSVQYLVLGILGLLLAKSVNKYVFAFVLLLLVMGLVYNVKPIRTKDVAYLDVISESINNPIRMAIGWYCVKFTDSNFHHVPASAFLSFWGGGIFLMALKRYSEMSLIENKVLMSQFRKSFEKWDPIKLLRFAILGALFSCTFLGILLAGYRVEYILGVPLIIELFNHYLKITLAMDITAQKPEKIWKNSGLITRMAVIIIVFTVLSFLEMPFIRAMVGF
jgi:decaprenyl-phosphate phosphoribosyltransferase